MLKGEKILYKVARHYKIIVEHKTTEKEYMILDKNIKIYPSFKEVLIDFYDRMMEDTLNKKHNWLKEIWYIENHCHMFD